MATPTASPTIGLRVSAEKKAQFAALAAAQGLSESALLGQLIDHVLDVPAGPVDSGLPTDSGTSTERISLRLRPGDRGLLTARAAARGMKPSTYLVALVHAHVRSEAPLPMQEVNWLKACVGELSALVRVMQSLRRADGVTLVEGSSMALHDLMQQALTRTDQVRYAMADLVRMNLKSWESGHG